MMRVLAIVGVLAAAVAMSGCGDDTGRPASRPKVTTTTATDPGQRAADAASRQRAIAGAKAAWQSAKDRGKDLSKGPCLGEVEPDWVADVAHDPRTDDDDDPKNQCDSYGKTAHHFVEVDEDGEVITVS
jgi:hypothetical protein